MSLVSVKSVEVEALGALHSGGLYLLQSQADLRLFRIGETRNLAARLNNHGRPAPLVRYKKAPNWTEVFRPWRAIWAVSTPDATPLGLKMCEHYLHAEFARRYAFVDDSGFEASGVLIADLIKLAESQLGVLRDILQKQQNPKFDKYAHYAMRWPIS